MDTWGRRTVAGLLCALLIPVGALPARAGGPFCSNDMAVTDERFSVTGSANGTVVLGDIGCAVVQRNTFCAMEMVEFDGSAEARDFATGEPVPLRAAFFVVESGVETPLHYDIAAFAARKTAEEFVAEQGAGRVLSYDDLVKLDLR